MFLIRAHHCTRGCSADLNDADQKGWSVLHLQVALHTYTSRFRGTRHNNNNFFTLPFDEHSHYPLGTRQSLSSSFMRARVRVKAFMDTAKKRAPPFLVVHVLLAAILLCCCRTGSCIPGDGDGASDGSSKCLLACVFNVQIWILSAAAVNSVLN